VYREASSQAVLLWCDRSEHADRLLWAYSVEKLGGKFRGAGSYASILVPISAANGSRSCRGGLKWP